MPIFPSFHWHHSSQIRSVANDLDLIISENQGEEVVSYQNEYTQLVVAGWRKASSLLKLATGFLNGVVFWLKLTCH